MEVLKICNYNTIFSFFCIVATIILASRCCYLYSLDDDLTIINFKKFNSGPENIYPSFSLCFEHSCLDEELERLGFNASCKDYHEINRGVGFNEKFFELDYDAFTIDLYKYILKTEIVMVNGSKIESFGTASIKNSKFLKPPYHGFIRPMASYKCYTFDTPYIQNTIFDYYAIHLDKSYPYLNISQIAIHYPNQLNQENLNILHVNDLDLKENATKESIEIQIQSMTRLSRRNKNMSPCNTDWANDDIINIDIISKENSCRHPHLNTTLHLPLCSQKEEIGSFGWRKLNDLKPPCISMIDSSADIHFNSDKLTDDTRITILVEFLMAGKFKEISMVKINQFFIIPRYQYGISIVVVNFWAIICYVSSFLGSSVL